MSDELVTFCKAMDGLWEVVNVTKEADGRFRVRYRSLDNPLVTWSHRPFHPETVPEVGARGRIGFIGTPYRGSN